MNRSFAILALVSLQAFAYTGQSSCRVAGPGVVICSLTEGSEKHVSSYMMGKDGTWTEKVYRPEEPGFQTEALYSYRYGKLDYSATCYSLASLGVPDSVFDGRSDIVGDSCDAVHEGLLSAISSGSPYEMPDFELSIGAGRTGKGPVCALYCTDPFTVISVSYDPASGKEKRRREHPVMDGKDHCMEFLSDPRPCWKF